VTLRGASPSAVRLALQHRDPLSGADGFAGVLPGDDAGEYSSVLVRDVLGREPLFVEREAPPDAAPAADRWEFEPAPLADPVPFPAGAIQGGEGRRQHLALPATRGMGDVGAGTPAVPDRAMSTLRSAIERTLDRLDPTVPVAFSGGVDSGLVAAGTDGPLYVAGFPESHDLEAARDAAASMDRDLRSIRLDHDDLERAVEAVVAATGRTNAMDVAIAVPLFLVAERVAADGFDRLALGQGADELFGGYAKVADAPDDERLDADSVLGARDEVLASLPDQLSRDVLAVRAAGVEPVTPLLADEVVAAALALPEALVVRDGRRKVALRRVAADHVPGAVADRDKKALQYGSLVSRELDRLARQAGFKRRMDDHVSRYVADLTGEGATVDGPSGSE